MLRADADYFDSATLCRHALLMLLDIAAAITR